MTTATALAFPDDPATLAGLPVSHLSQLTKSIPPPPGFDPKSWKSVAHLLPKAEKVTLLQAAHYGIPHNISHLPAKGQKLYEANQAKQAAHKAAKVKTGTNCAATLGKTLVEAVEDAPSALAMKLADIGGFFAQHVAEPSETKIHVLNNLRTSLKALLDEDPLTAVLDPAYDSAKQVHEWMGWLRNAVEDFNEGKFLEQAVSTTDFAAQALTKVTAALGDDPGDLKGLAQFSEVMLGKVKSQQAVASQKVLTSKKIVSQGNIYALSSVEDVQANALLDAFAELAEETPTSLQKKLLPKDVESLLVNAEVLAQDVLTDPTMAPKLAALGVDELDAFTAHLKKVQHLAADVQFDPKLEPWMDGLSAVLDAKAVASTVVEAAADEVAAAAIATNIGALQGQPAAVLKALGGQLAEKVGVTPSLAKSYMDKDVLASFIGKVQWQTASGKAVDFTDEVAAAEAKYAAHQAAQKAKKAGTKGTQDVADAQAAPGTAQTTAKSLDEAAQDAVATAPPVIGDEVLADGLEQFGASPEAAEAVIEHGHHKPAQVTHTWSPNPNEVPLPGAHSKQTFLDENGDVWMWKKAFEGTDDVEAAAHEIGWLLGIDMADIRVVANFPTRFGATQSRFGTIQKFHKGVKGDLKGTRLATLEPEQIAQIQEHQVLDWLLAQHDTHAENLLIHADGHLIPIDKGQAWKFLGTDKLSTDYNPVSQTVYSTLWNDVMAGRVAANFDAIDSMLAKVESLDEDELRRLLLPVFQKRFSANKGSLHFLGGKAAQSPEAMLEMVLERKRTIRADFTAFYKDIAKRAGIDWEPSWAKAVQQAAEEGLEGAEAAAAVQGISTPVDTAFAAAVDASAAGGRALHLAGEEISSGQALLWQETTASGSKMLRMELRLEAEADQRITQVFADASGQAPVSNAAKAAVKVADPYYSDVLNGAKTINHHVGDQAYNASKIASLGEAKKLAKQFAGDTTDFEGLMLSGSISPEAYASGTAKIAQGKHYLDLIEDAEAAMAAGAKTTKLVTAFDGDAVYAKQLAEAEEKLGKASPKAVTVEPEPVFVGKPAKEMDTFADLVAEPDEYMGYRRTLRRHNLPGQQYVGTIDVDGTKVTVRYTGSSMTSQIPRKALLDIEVDGWDGSEEFIKKAMRAVERLGVDMRLANETDEALTYWRVATRSMKFSKEYKSGAGAGAYGKVRATIDKIEQRIASTPGISATDEIAVFKEEWAAVFGQDAVDSAVPRLVHTHDLKGREVGYGHHLRFDLPEDLGFPYQKGGKSMGIATGIQSHNLDPTSLIDNPGAESAQELVRLGQYGKRSTTSQSADMGTGGAHGVFTSQGFSSWQSGREVLVMNPSTVMRRTSTAAYPRDRFGDLSERGDYHQLSPDTWQSQYVSTSMRGNNETLVRHNVSYADDMELYFVRSRNKRTEIIDSLKRQGITEIRGVPVEDRIIHAATDEEIVERTSAYFKANPHLYRRSYVHEPTPGTKAVAPKPAAAAPAPAPPFTPSTVGTGGAPVANAYAAVIDSIKSGHVKNSVQAKVKATSATLKKSSAKVHADFDDYLAKYHNYPGDSQTKKFDSFLAFAKKKAQIEHDISGFTTTADKVAWVLDNAPYGAAKNDTVADLMGKTWKELQQEGKANKGNQTFVEWLKGEAKKLDVADDPAEFTGTVTINVYGGQVPKQVNPQAASDLLHETVNVTDTEAKKLIAQALGADPTDSWVVDSIYKGLYDDFHTTSVDAIADGLLKMVKKEADSLGIKIKPFVSEAKKADILSKVVDHTVGIPTPIPHAKAALEMALNDLKLTNNFGPALQTVADAFKIPKGPGGTAQDVAEWFDAGVKAGTFQSGPSFGTQGILEGLIDYLEPKPASSMGAKVIAQLPGLKPITVDDYNEIYDAVQEYIGNNSTITEFWKVMGSNPAGKDWDDLTSVWIDEGGELSLPEFILKKMDEGIADITSGPGLDAGDLVAAAPTAPGVGGIVNAADATEDLVGAYTTEVAGEKVFHYAMPLGKVPVQFVKAGSGGTNIIAQGWNEDVWYVIASNIKGKTTKEQIADYLQAINHPAMEPF